MFHTQSNYNQMVVKDQRLGNIFPSVPHPVFKRGKNLQNLLCRARLPPVRKVTTRAESTESRNGLTRCNRGLARKGCVARPFITSRPNEVVKKVRINSTGREIGIEGRINCKTQGGYLYLLWSSKAPTLQYLGSSTREPRFRLAEHKRDIQSGDITKAVPKHFIETKSTIADLMFVPFKKIISNDPLILRHFETKLINEYNMLEAGINKILT